MATPPAAVATVVGVASPPAVVVAAVVAVVDSVVDAVVVGEVLDLP
jgi:hypothetical protein